MIKVLVILFVLGLVFFRIIGFFIRLLTGSTAPDKQQRTRHYSQPQKDARREGNINIDFVPKKGKKGDEFNGGEYVEFEEVD